MESNILLWSKDTDFIRINEGTGDNLLREDRAAGYVDYIMLDYMEYDGDELTEMDGDQIMLTQLYQEQFHSVQDVINYLVDCGFIPRESYLILYPDCKEV